MWIFSQANPRVARDLGELLRGTRITPAQIHALSQSVGTEEQALAGRMKLLAELAATDRQRLADSIASGRIDPALARDRLIGLHRASQPLLDAMVARGSSPTPSATTDATTYGPERERVFRQLLAATQPPTSRPPAFDNGTQQVTVAVMDSGTGGLVAGSTIESVLDANGDGKITFAYVTDHGANTYGNRQPEEIARLTNDTLRYAQDTLKADLIIMACNTATASFPNGGLNGVTIPVVDLIRNTANVMLEQGGEHPAMFATAAMSAPGPDGMNMYERYLDQQGVRLTSIAAPNWAGYVNEGDHLNPEKVQGVLQNVRERVAQLPLNTTAVFLNCTHYPALKTEIERAIYERWRVEAPGTPVPRVIDPMQAQARAALAEVQRIRQQDRADAGTGAPRTLITTGSPEIVAEQGYTLFDDPNNVVFGLNPTYQLPPFDPTLSSMPVPFSSLPGTLRDAISAGARVGFTPLPINQSRLPGDVVSGRVDLNAQPTGAKDDRFLRLREQAYQVIEQKIAAARIADPAEVARVRAEARTQVDQAFERRSLDLAGFIPLQLPPGTTPAQAQAVANVLQLFANNSISARTFEELPPNPTLQAVRAELRQALAGTGMADAEVNQFMARVELQLDLWVTNMNVRRQDQVHRMSEELSRVLSELRMP
jgi:glutamate racemase